jgi:hypothetical protein
MEYAGVKVAFVQRFKDKQTDQYNYTRLQKASQMEGETPEMYLDRLQKLCQRTIQRTENPVQQAIQNREADKRLLVAFISGLRRVPGKHVRLQMPDMVDSSLDSEITAPNAKTSKKDGARGNRYNKQTVFSVRGNHGNLQRPNNWTPPG